MPGFNDTGPEPYKSFASLGLPLAVYTAMDQAIRAILVVIEYDAIKIGRLGKLAEAMKTIHSVVDMCSNGNKVPILYLVTRPELPPAKYIIGDDEDEYRRLCNVNETAKAFMNEIKNFLKKEKAFLVEPDFNLEENLIEVKKLQDCQLILGNLKLFQPQQLNYLQNIANRLYRNNRIDRGNLAIEKENFIKELKELGDIEAESIEMMSQFIDDVLSKLGKSNQDNEVVTKMVDKKRY